MPMTMEGTPLRTSAAKRTTEEKREWGYSARWIPQMQPMGTARNDAMAISTTVPKIALAMPPPTSPTGLGICVKNAQFSDPAPCLIT